MLNVLSINNQGTGTGQIGLSGSNVTYGNTIIGTCSGGTGTDNLVITMNAGSTPTAIQALLRNITYSNTNISNPSISARTNSSWPSSRCSARYYAVYNITLRKQASFLALMRSLLSAGAGGDELGGMTMC